jgi:hypothetical protein
MGLALKNDCVEFTFFRRRINVNSHTLSFYDFTVDFTAFCIDFTFLVYLMGKIIIRPDGDSNPRPFELIFGIKTPNRILAFTAIRTLDQLLNLNLNNILDSIDF